MIIGKLDYEKTVYQNELTPMDASLSVVSSEEDGLVSMEIKPEESADFVDLDDRNRMAYAYSTTGSKTATLRIKTTETPDGQLFTFTLNVVAVPEVFADDADLVSRVPAIHDQLTPGYSSFIRTHVAVMNEILDDLDRRGIRAADCTRLEYDDLAESEEVWKWALYLALAMIFEDLVEKPDDRFDELGKKYRSFATSASAVPSISIKKEDPTQKVIYQMGTIGVGRA